MAIPSMAEKIAKLVQAQADAKRLGEEELRLACSSPGQTRSSWKTE